MAVFRCTAGGWVVFFCTDGVITSQSWHGWKIIPHCFCCFSPVRPRTGDPLRRDFANQQTVAWTADVLLSNGSVLYRLWKEGWRHEEEMNKETKTQAFQFSVFSFLTFWGSDIKLKGSFFDLISRNSANPRRIETRSARRCQRLGAETRHSVQMFDVSWFLTTLAINLLTPPHLWKHYSPGRKQTNLWWKQESKLRA